MPHNQVAARKKVFLNLETRKGGYCSEHPGVDWPDAVIGSSLGGLFQEEGTQVVFPGILIRDCAADSQDC